MTAETSSIFRASPYFEIVEGSFFGVEIREFHACEAPGMCDPGNLFTGTLVDRGGTWTLDVYSYTLSGPCEFLRNLGPVENTDAGVRIAVKEQYDADAPPE